jgi:hypothetical protein
MKFWDNSPGKLFISKDRTGPGISDLILIAKKAKNIILPFPWLF